MSKNIFSKPKTIKEVFKDERYLYPDHIPERLPHRDAEIDSLVYAFMPVLKGKRPRNVFVYGGTGVGKTATVKYVLNELENFSDRAKGIYINCFEFNTRHAVLSRITNFLGYATPRRGIATDEVYTKFLGALRNVEFIPLIVLDEVDQLLEHSASDGTSKLFYDLLRVIEHQKSRIGLIFISNDTGFTSKLDARVRSSLTEDSIKFPKYTPQQLKDILRERVKYAFLANVLDPEAINLAAAHAAKLGGDARIAIECLFKAGRDAEKENTGKVTPEHVRNSFKYVDSTPIKKLLPNLSENEKLILKMLSKLDAEINSGELYEHYSAKTKKPLTQRSFRDLISKLESINLISAPLVESGMRGKTRAISLKVSKQAVSELIF